MSGIILYTLVLILQSAGSNRAANAISTIENIQTKEICEAYGKSFVKNTQPEVIRNTYNRSSYLCIPTVSK